MENFDYNDAITCLNRKKEIQSSQIPIEDLSDLINQNANEQKFLKLIKKDLSFLADVFAQPVDEYICLSEYHICEKIVDFIVLTSRSRMEVCLIEVKGADFNICKKNHYGGMTSHIHAAEKQLLQHELYIQQNYITFIKKIHSTKHDVVTGAYSANYLLGPKGNLFVDPEKDIKLRKIIIGGKESNDYRDSHECSMFEQDHKNLSIYSWESFLRRVDQQHGHY